MEFIKTLSAESQYADNLNNIFELGNESGDRTGTGTTRIQSTVVHADLRNHFPILVGKKINFQNAFVEMVWMLCGRTDIQWLRDNGVNYWNEWEDADGTIGKGYGQQFRDFNGVDQLKDAVNELKLNPNSRRALISLWNPVDLNKTTLPPCHYSYHFLSYVDQHTGKRMLDLHTTQRSADYFLGVPYNLCMSGIFLTLMAKAVNMEVGSIHQTFHDSHIYSNHEDQVYKYLKNVFEDRENLFNKKYHSLTTYADEMKTEPIEERNFLTVEPAVAPILDFSNDFELSNFETFDDMLEYICSEFSQKKSPLKIINYKSYPFIKAKVSA